MVRISINQFETINLTDQFVHIPPIMQNHQNSVKQNSSKHMQMPATSAPDNKIIAEWLQTISKTSKCSPRKPLQQQLQSLSLSYKNAQQKLLSLQKQVYYQSLHNQKQRSIIQILKYIINGSLDDDTILSYLVQMQDQSSCNVSNVSNSAQYQSKYQIKTELQEIKQIVLKQKTQTKRSQNNKTQAISDLKKELVKNNQIKKQLMQDLDRTLNDKYALQNMVEQLKNKYVSSQQQVAALTKQLSQMNAKYNQISQSNKLLQKLIDSKNIQIQQYETKLRSIKDQFIRIAKIKTVQTDVDLTEIDTILKCSRKIQQKLDKYRNIARQMSQKLKKANNSVQLISKMKQFMPQSAVKLCQQYEQTSQSCLLKEIEGIAKLQCKKYQQLENCQQQVWRLRNRMLRQSGGESWLKSRKTGASHSQNKQNLQPNLNYRQVGNEQESNIVIKQKQKEVQLSEQKSKTFITTEFQIGNEQFNQ